MKRVHWGWLQDRFYTYDYDTGTKAIKMCQDETLNDFAFGLEGTKGEHERIKLRIPLITPNKKFWGWCRKKTRRVKVTIEIF